MSEAITFITGAIAGIVAGYVFRDFKIYLDEELRIRRTMREMRERVDREDAA